MNNTPETDKSWDAQVISDTPYHEAWEEMIDHASELERKFMLLSSAYALQTRSLAEAIKSHDEVSSQLEKLQQSILDLSHPNMKLLLEERNEAFQRLLVKRSNNRRLDGCNKRLQRELVETKENLKITQDAWIQAKAERAEAARERDEAVNDYETAVLREHRMQEQRDVLVEALREAWYAMDEVDEINGIDRMIDWQNKYAKYVYE
jgi:Na+/phosphate symporter